MVKIEYAGGNAPSFGRASEALERLAELPISGKHVQRITEKLGSERTGQRDAQARQMEAGQLRPRYAEAPRVAAIHLDAGKVQLRQDDGRPGVRQARWSDTKVGCFLTYTAPVDGTDPRPEPPAAFLDPPRVMRLCQEMSRVRSAPPPAQQQPLPPPEPAPPQSKPPARRAPLVRTVVATTQPSEAFGWMVAAEACRRGFYEAPRRALVGDGGNWIEPLGQMHFPGWDQVLDFVHLLTHLYAAAMAAHAGRPKRAWNLYERLLRAAWSGQVARVQSLLRAQRRRLGGAPGKTRDGEGAPAAPNDGAVAVVDRTLNYVQNNAARMDYPRYRREGLPITSAAVESTIKQINYRVKGTEKFWVGQRLESVLQVRAAYLSDDGRAEAFHTQRPRSRAAGRNRFGRVA